MIKIDFDDIKTMVEMGEKYKEKEKRVREVVEDASRFLNSSYIDKVYFQEKDCYGATQLDEKLTPRKKDLYPCILRKMNGEVQKLLDEKKELEKIGILIRDYNYFVGKGEERLSVFEKAKEIKEIIKNELEKKEGDE